MDRVIYRKLTRKSTLGFGQYRDMTVADLMYTLDAYGKDYLRWCYFNCSNITFFDDILDELEIPESLRFEKPGTNPEAFKELTKEIKKRKFNEIYGGLDEKEKVVALAKRKQRRARNKKLDCLRSEQKHRVTKGAMAWKNQGHKIGDK